MNKYERTMTPVDKDAVSRRDLYGKALAWAIGRHAGQVDKSGHPYIEHVARVSANCSWHSTEAMIVGILHDTVEDTDDTIMMIEVGFGTRIADGVDAITHRPNEPHVDYMARVVRNGLARVAKIADFADNGSPDRMIEDARHTVRLERYLEGLRYLLNVDRWQMDRHTLEWYEGRIGAMVQELDARVSLF